MKKILLIPLLAFSINSVFASPAVMVGVSYNFDSRDFGVTAKLLSDDEEDEIVGAVGATYYPGSTTSKFGVDAGVGYTFDNAAAVVSWDFIRKESQVSVGWADVDDDAPTSGGTPEVPPTDETDGIPL